MFKYADLHWWPVRWPSLFCQTMQPENMLMSTSKTPKKSSVTCPRNPGSKMTIWDFSSDEFFQASIDFSILRGRLKKTWKSISILFEYLGVSKNMRKPPKASILLGFSIIFNIHFGGFTPIFGNNQYFDGAILDQGTSECLTLPIDFTASHWMPELLTLTFWRQRNAMFFLTLPIRANSHPIPSLMPTAMVEWCTNWETSWHQQGLMGLYPPWN